MSVTASDGVLFAWSSGKDSALAFYELQRGGQHDIRALLTTLTEGYDRISMHGVREALLDRQAASVGMDLAKVRIPRDSSMQEYENRMRQTLEHYRDEGVSSVAFGDIFLEDLRKDRQDKLAQVGMEAIFPIWRRDTAELASEFIDAGFKAVITCADSQMLDGAFAGRDFDRQFLSDLPESVDPCGENGEFHSFVHDGPIFFGKIPYEVGEIVLRDNRFWFCDLIPA